MSLHRTRIGVPALIDRTGTSGTVRSGQFGVPAIRAREAVA